MGIVTGMKELTEGIRSSTVDRKERLSLLKGETKELRHAAAGQLHDFSTHRLEVKRQLEKHLTANAKDRKQAVKASLKESQNLIKNFQTERKKGSVQTKKVLALGIEKLAAEEKERKSQVKNSLKQVKDSRHDTNVQMRDELAQSRYDIKSQVKESLGEAESLVNGFQESRSKLKANQQKDLRKDNENRKNAVKDMLGGFRGTRDGIKTELSQASKAWKGVGSKHQTTPEAKPGKEVKTSDSLEKKLLQVINGNTGGFTLSQAAETFGLAPILLGKSAKALMEKGKIRKEGKTYYPVNGR